MKKTSAKRLAAAGISPSAVYDLARCLVRQTGEWPAAYRQAIRLIRAGFVWDRPSHTLNLARAAGSRQGLSGPDHCGEFIFAWCSVGASGRIHPEGGNSYHRGRLLWWELPDIWAFTSRLLAEKRASR